jgi:hypothetical protein
VPKQNKSDGRDSAAEDARKAADAAEKLISEMRRPAEAPRRAGNADDPGMETT